MLRSLRQLWRDLVSYPDRYVDRAVSEALEAPPPVEWDMRPMSSLVVPPAYQVWCTGCGAEAEAPQGMPIPTALCLLRHNPDCRHSAERRPERAEALLDAAADARGMTDPPAPDTEEWAQWLEARARREERRNCRHHGGREPCHQVLCMREEEPCATTAESTPDGSATSDLRIVSASDARQNSTAGSASLTPDADILCAYAGKGEQFEGAWCLLDCDGPAGSGCMRLAMEQAMGQESTQPSWTTLENSPGLPEDWVRWKCPGCGKRGMAAPGATIACPCGRSTRSASAPTDARRYVLDQWVGAEAGMQERERAESTPSPCPFRDAHPTWTCIFEAGHPGKHADPNRGAWS